MQLEALKVFCDVVETRSFSRAARINKVTQSAVSQQIRALEKRFGKKLIDREPRAAHPTPAGERLYEAAREVLARFAELEARVREEGPEAAGPVTLATINSVGLHELQPHLKEMLRRHPRVQVKLVYRTSDQIYEAVASGEADLGVVAYPHPTRGITSMPFGEDRLVLVTPAGHELARERTVPLSRLQRMPFVAFDQGIPTREAIDEILRKHGAEPRVVAELDNVETLKRAVEIGMGVSIVPRAAIANEVASGTLAEVQLADGDFRRPLALLVRTGRSLPRAAAALLDVLAPR